MNEINKDKIRIISELKFLLEGFKETLKEIEIKNNKKLEKEIFQIENLFYNSLRGTFTLSCPPSEKDLEWINDSIDTFHRNFRDNSNLIVDDKIISKKVEDLFSAIVQLNDKLRLLK